jgi:hypothetical protein
MTGVKMRRTGVLTGCGADHDDFFLRAAGPLIRRFGDALDRGCPVECS